MSAAKEKAYRRSWKNLLLDKGYQLRFTLFMVGVSAILMACLGYWVLQEARKTTAVGINGLLGHPCPPLPEGAQPAREGVIIDDITEMRPPAAPGAGDAPGDAEAAGEPAGAPGAESGAEPGAESEERTAAGQPAGDPAAARERSRVVLDESTMEIDASKDLEAGTRAPTAGPGFLAAVLGHHQCRNEQVAKIADLRAGYQRIAVVMSLVGVVLIVGLFFYGIKMTHRVAGPLHKITLYFDKMRQGRLDQVYDLRKGDQLIEFYERFKAAHMGVKGMQEQDIVHLRAIVEAADTEGLASQSPSVAAALDELREVLARKEKSLE